MVLSYGVFSAVGAVLFGVVLALLIGGLPDWAQKSRQADPSGEALDTLRWQQLPDAPTGAPAPQT